MLSPDLVLTDGRGRLQVTEGVKVCAVFLSSRLQLLFLHRPRSRRQWMSLRTRVGQWLATPRVATPRRLEIKRFESELILIWILGFIPVAFRGYFVKDWIGDGIAASTAKEVSLFERLCWREFERKLGHFRTYILRLFHLLLSWKKNKIVLMKFLKIKKVKHSVQQVHYLKIKKCHILEKEVRDI